MADEFETADDWMSLYGYRPVKPTMGDRRYLVGPFRLGGTLTTATADDSVDLIGVDSMLNDPEIVEAWGIKTGSSNIEAVLHVQAVRIRFVSDEFRTLDPSLKAALLANLQLKYKVNGQNHFEPLDTACVESFQRNVELQAAPADQELAEVKGRWMKLKRPFQVLTDVDTMEVIAADSIAHGGLAFFFDVAGFLFPDDAARDDRFADRVSGICNEGAEIETVVQSEILSTQIGTQIPMVNFLNT